MKPIDDIEKDVVEETLKHEITKTRAADVLEKFQNGNDRTKQLIASYRRTDATLHKGKP